MVKTVKPNHSKLGPKYKAKARQIAEKIETMDKHKIFEELTTKKSITIDIDGESIKLSMDDFEIVETEKEHIAKTQIEDVILLLDTNLTPDLEAEGFAREIVRRIQSMRKELDLDVEDKIKTEIIAPSDKIKSLENWKDYIMVETRSIGISFVDSPSGKLVKKWNIDAIEVEIGISN